MDNIIMAHDISELTTKSEGARIVEANKLTMRDHQLVKYHGVEELTTEET